VALGFTANLQAAEVRELKLEIQLVWGTDDAKSPNPKHRPVEREIREKIKNGPLKWKNYFEVNRKTITLGAEMQTVTLSDKCKVEIKNLGKGHIEVGVLGDGEPVVTRKQTLPKGETLFVGGNAPNSTAWLVVLKRLE
jgi:hypothetical protein